MQKRSLRYPPPIVNHVKRRTREGWSAKHISDELVNLVEEETFVDEEGIQRPNPLYKQPTPPEKTVQRWHREFRSEPGGPIDSPSATPEKWHSGMEENPDDARVILSVLAEVVNHSKGYRHRFNKAMAGQVLRVTKLAPGVPPYLAWLLAWNYLQAQQEEDAATMEALDVFLGMMPWEKGQAFSNYKHLVELGRITPVHSELIEGIEEIIARQSQSSREGIYL